MKLFSRPRGSWGWVRLGGIILLAALLLWTLIAVLLDWWTGYRFYSLLDRFELAVLPLLAVFVGSWLEDQDQRADNERAQHHQDEQAAAAHRKAILRNIHALIENVQKDAHPGALSQQTRQQILFAIRSALPELDRHGRGDLLHFLFERGLLTGDSPVLNLTGLDLSGVILHTPHLAAIHLSGADLSAARLDSAHLAGSRLDGCVLKKAFLRRADLRRACLQGADLTRAHLQHAVLEDASLSGACLENTQLAHASLRGATGLDLAALDQAILIETILPTGEKTTNARGKEYLRSKEFAALVDRL